MKNIKNDCGRTKTDIDTVKKRNSNISKREIKMLSFRLFKKGGYWAVFSEEDFTEQDVQANLETK